MAQSIEEEICKFCSTLDNTKTQYKYQETTIIMGDLNAKVRKEQYGKIV